MKVKTKTVFIPILILIISIASIWITSAWKLFKWLPVHFGKPEPRISMQFSEDQSFVEIASASILEMFSSSIDMDDIEDFVNQHPNNADYQFALGVLCMMENRGDPTPFFRKAEQNDPSNALYPFWLGLTYARNQSGSYWGTPSMADSAIAAFERAEKLEPDNAAIDLAKLDIYYTSVDTVADQNYRLRRDKDFVSRHNLLTEQGREAIEAALTKTKYRGHATETIEPVFRLLKDSGENTFFAKIQIYSAFPLQRFLSQAGGLRIYIEDIRPFDDRARTEALADTLLRLSNLGLMMRDDPSRTLIQHMIGSFISTSFFDLMGDLYYLNDMPATARLTGQCYAETKNARTFIIPPIVYGFWRTLIGRVFPALAIFVLIQPVLYLSLVIALMAIIILLFRRDLQNKPGIPAGLMTVIYGVLLSVIFFVLSISPDYLFEPYLIITSGVVVVGLGILVYRMMKRRSSPEKSLFAPILIIVIGISGVVSVLARIPYLAYLGFPLAVCAQTFRYSRKYSAGFFDMMPFIARVSTGLFAFLSLVILVIWFVVASPLTKIIDMTDYNIMVEFGGPGAKLYPSDYSSIVHFKPTPDYSNPKLDKRIDRLEEMFGKMK